MAKEIKRWITVNGAHVPIYEGDDDWIDFATRQRYSRYIDDHSFDDKLDSDEKTWVEALRQEKYGGQKSTENESVKPWSKAEEKRTSETSKFIFNKINEGEEWQEYYEENFVEEIAKHTISIPGYKDEEVTLQKMNLTYVQNWDEEGNRVKKGKALTGSTYYVVYGEDGSIDETNFAYKTKADAEHAMQLYIQEITEYRRKH